MSQPQSAFITAIGTAVPSHQVLQPEAAEFMGRNVAQDEKTRRQIRMLYQATGISKRHSVLDDFGQGEGKGLFAKEGEIQEFPGTQLRMERYRQEACPLGAAAVRDALGDRDLSAITHLITVSCTGMYAPGLDIDLVRELGLTSSVQRTCINFMGCYAAFNALKVADAIVRANPASQVLIVSVELCTLHFQPDTHRDQLVANAIFADGAAAVLVGSQPGPGWNYALKSFSCQLIPEGAGDMAWTIMDDGFKMVLSAYVPHLLSGATDETLQALVRDLPIEADDISHFALHPGGRRILEALEKALDLPSEANASAYHVLKNYGNMSSATVLFVLKEKLASLTPADEQAYLLSMAFGPGLTLESGMMQLTYRHA
jgi:predicted naringenin-chalcone synthase